jgi:hypothetical protein
MIRLLLRLHVRVVHTFTGTFDLSFIDPGLSILAHSSKACQHKMLRCSFLERFLDLMMQGIITSGNEAAGSSFRTACF